MFWRPVASTSLETCAFFHSFPRFSSNKPRDELETGLAVLRSILTSGLLLCPERIFFPFAERGDKGYLDGSFVYQTRTCFTYIRRAELVRHASIFGAFSLEFDVTQLRRLGAIPVVYIPQPATSDSAGGYDHFANNVIHQLRDASTLIQEMSDTLNHFEAADRIGSATITVNDAGRHLALDVPSVNFILSYLRGSKGSLENIYAYLEVFANLFYHVDSAREQVYFSGVDLEYYRQMEWRIISGLTMEPSYLDRALTDQEISELETISPFFGKLVEDKEGRARPRSSLLRIITRFETREFNHLIRRIWIPDIKQRDVETMLRQASLEIPVSVLEYEKIQSIRKRTS